MAFVANEQPRIKVWTQIVLVVTDERIGHDAGFVATDGGDILLTQDSRFPVARRRYPYIRTVVALHWQDAIGRLVDFRRGCLLLQVQFIHLAQRHARIVVLEQLIVRQETSTDKRGVIVVRLDADVVGPAVIVAIADFYFCGLRLVEGSVKCVAVGFHAALDVNLSAVLDVVLGNGAEDQRFGGRYDILAEDDLADLLRGIYFVDAGVAVDFHLQLYHAAEVGRHDEVGAKLLGERFGTGVVNACRTFLGQRGYCSAEVGVKHAFAAGQLVDFQTVQYAQVDGLCGHDVLDKHVGFIAAVPLGS